MFNRPRAHIRGDIKHLQGRFKTWKRKWVFNQPYTSEDDEIHDTQEPGEHGSDNADERQCERLTIVERYQRPIR